MKRSYSVEDARLIDRYLKQRFEDQLDVFASEASGRDYTKSHTGEYVDEHIQNIWVGFFLNFMIVRRGANGDSIDIRPGLVPEAVEFLDQRKARLECTCFPCQP